MRPSFLSCDGTGVITRSFTGGPSSIFGTMVFLCGAFVIFLNPSLELACVQQQQTIIIHVVVVVIVVQQKQELYQEMIWGLYTCSRK